MRQVQVLTGAAAILFVLFFVQGVLAADTYGYVTQWGSNGSSLGQFYYAQGIAVDSQGTTYVADAANHRIQKFNASGVYAWGTFGSANGQMAYPYGVAVDSAGNVYVADTSNNRIQKFTTDGKYITKWGSSGPGNGQFSFPSGVAVDSAGNVYVVDTSNNRIQKFTSDGTYLDQWGSMGFGDGEFKYPYGIAVDLTGNVFVADTDNNRIQMFTSGGDFIRKWGWFGTSAGDFKWPYGIAVDKEGSVYVADTFNNRTQKFSTAGVSTWGTSGSGNGEFNNPRGIAVDTDGIVYVMDTYNMRIQKFALVPPTGSIEVTSTPTGAWIILDSVNTSVQTPATLTDITPGNHLVTARMSWYNSPSPQTVTIISKETQTVNLDLGVKHGHLWIKTNVTGADLTIDPNPFIENGDTYTYKIPADNDNLLLWNVLPGVYQISVTKAGYLSSTKTFIALAGQEVPANFKLDPQPTEGSIPVSSIPAGAKIFLNGEDTGELTPHTFNAVTPGIYTVNVTLDGYYPAVTQSVTVVASKESPAVFTLVRIPKGNIHVTSVPEGAAIFVNGVDMQVVTPSTFSGLGTGTYEVTLDLLGYHPATRTVTVVDQQVTEANIILAKAPTLHVTSTPPGASIIVDNLDSGKVTPATVDNYDPGSHVVFVKLAGYITPQSKTITLNDGEETDVDFTLTLAPTTGSIHVVSEPAGAEIFIDGYNSGEVTPFTFDNKEPGNYNIYVTHDGFYSSDVRTAKVVAGEITESGFVLLPVDGTLHVTSTPAGAKILIGGADTGKITPDTFSRTPGNYAVQVTLDGYQDDSQLVTVVSQKQTDVDFILLQNPADMGSILVKSVPTGAEIYLDSADTGHITPYMIPDVSTGAHGVYVTYAGYVTPVKQDVTVVAGKTATAEFTLVLLPPEKGSLTVDSTPQGAEIYFDGIDTGEQTPHTFADLDQGTYRVKVTLAGYEDKEAYLPVGDNPTGMVFYLVELPPVGGTLKVTSLPAGASIWIDGQDTHKVTPSVFTKESGPYEVRVSLKCYTEPALQMVTVSPNTPATADFALESDGTCTPTPEFPSPAVPAVILVGCIGVVALFSRSRE